MTGSSERPTPLSTGTRVRDFASDVARTWITPLIISGLNLGVLTLLLPFQPLAFALLALAAASSVALFVVARRRKNWTGHLLTMASATAAMLGICGGAAGPLLVARAPVYVFLSNDVASTQSRFVASGRDHTPVVVLADPVRKFLRPVWATLSPHRVRILQFDPTNGGGIRLPLHGAYFSEEMLPAGRAVHRITFPLVAPTVTMDLRHPYPLTRKPDGDGTFLFGLGVRSSPAVEADMLPQEGARWDSVRSSNPPTDQELAYAATLDEGLSLIIYGNVGEALTTLDRASSLAPSLAERARSLCVLGDVTAAMLDGFLGSLQSLTVYNAAYDTLLPLIERGKLNSPDPAIDWSVQRLIAVYESPFGRYPDRAKRLRSVARLNPRPDEQSVLPRRVRDVFAQLRPVFERSKTCGLTREEALAPMRLLLDAMLHELPGSKASFATLSARAMLLSDSQFDDAASAAAQDADAAFRFVLEGTAGSAMYMLTGDKATIALRLARLREVAGRVDPHIRAAALEKVEAVQQLFARGIGAAFMSADEAPFWKDPQLNYNPFVQSDRVIVACLRMHDELRLIAWKYRDQVDRDGPPPEAIPPHQHLPSAVQEWWDSRFIDEVCHRALWSMFAVAQRKGDAEGSRPATTKRLALMIGEPEELVADRRGRPFLPWMAFVARVLEEEHGALHEDLREEIERRLQLPYLTAVVMEKSDDLLAHERWPALDGVLGAHPNDSSQEGAR